MVVGAIPESFESSASPVTPSASAIISSSVKARTTDCTRSRGRSSVTFFSPRLALSERANRIL
jgi:hypothetical protein